MTATTFNTTISTLDQNLADHYRAYGLVHQAYISSPTRHYVWALRHHYRHIVAIERERLRLAEAFHFRTWRD